VSSDTLHTSHLWLCGVFWHITYFASVCMWCFLIH